MTLLVLAMSAEIVRTTYPAALAIVLGTQMIRIRTWMLSTVERFLLCVVDVVGGW